MAGSTTKINKNEPSISKCPSMSCSLWQEGTFFASFRVNLGARPASQDEGNLVHEIGDVVSYIKGLAASRRGQRAEVVTCWVDGPAQAHDQAHVVERLHDGCGGFLRCLGRLTSKDFEENETPSAQAQNETNLWVDIP